MDSIQKLMPSDTCAERPAVLRELRSITLTDFSDDQSLAERLAIDLNKVLPWNEIKLERAEAEVVRTVVVARFLAVIEKQVAQVLPPNANVGQEAAETVTPVEMGEFKRLLAIKK